MHIVKLKFEFKKTLYYELGLYINHLLINSGISLRYLCKRIHISSKTYEMLITGVETRLNMYIRVIWGLMIEYTLEERRTIGAIVYCFCLKGVMRGMIVDCY